jgi:hypothetical protein
MSGGWASITDSQGRFTGAGTVETGGDVEELAEELFGMIWWLAGRCSALADGAPDYRDDALAWVSEAGRHSRDGLVLGGCRAADEET